MDLDKLLGIDRSDPEMAAALAYVEEREAWYDLIGAEPMPDGVEHCPGCGGEICIWNSHIYPQEAPR